MSSQPIAKSPESNAASALSIAGAPARLSALSALVHTLDKGRPMDNAWPQDRYFSGLGPSDRAFTQLLAKTTLRRLGQIDALLTHFLDRPLSPKHTRIMHTLRLGVAQLLWLNTPPHAAVHSSVEMVRLLKLEKYTGLVNAILKKVAQHGKELAETQDAAQLNTPAWLYERWIQAYGEATARRIALAHLEEPSLDISVKEDAPHWAGLLQGRLLPTGTVRMRDTRNITQLQGFDEGLWWVQDAAAAIPAKLLGDVRGKRVIDMCAAPGGKTAQLAVAGARVAAVDVSKDRVAMLKSNVHRLKLQADYITGDASKWQPVYTPDAILLDAPCSATGTLRRHPDVAWHRKPEDIERLTATQKRLLHHALDMLTPGGTLVYAVCSLQPEEGEAQIAALLQERDDTTLIPVDAAAVGLPAECVTSRGELRTLPCHLQEFGGLDGFYAAHLHKKEE